MVLRAHNGALTDSRWSISTLGDAAGWPAGFVAVGVEDEPAGQRTREQACLDMLLARTNDGVVISDADGRIRTVNCAARELLGIGGLEIEGQRLDDTHELLDHPQRNLLQAITPPGTSERGDRSGADETSWQKEVTLQHPTFTQLRVECCPITSGTNEAARVAYLIRNLTAERDAEQMSRDIVATVSHDLRTPLTSVLGFAILLAEGRIGRLTPRQLTTVGRVRRQAARLLGLVNDLLDTAQLERNELRLDTGQIPIRDALRSRIDAAMAMAEQKQLRIESRVSETLPMVVGDEARLVRAIDILLDNAVRFSPRNETVEVSAWAENGYVIISVKDNGPGIAKSALAHIFDKFHQVFPHGKKTRGSGLGLYLAANIIRLHHGKMWVEASPGKGCKFTLTLPAVRQEREPADADEPLHDAAQDAAMPQAETPSGEGGQ